MLYFQSKVNNFIRDREIIAQQEPAGTIWASAITENATEEPPLLYENMSSCVVLGGSWCWLFLLLLFSPFVFRVSNLLVEHSPVGSGAYRSVGEWLEAIKMGRYTEIFMENGYSSMDAVAQVTLE